MKISVLADNVVNQIAAGEVVDRPASVVRELVDNAIDAAATEVSIYLEGGGRSLIRVNDDGHGMSRDDALLAFERHATSKIKEATDLLAVESFGFRGEALSSIAAVAKVRLRTRTAESQTATEIFVQGGKLNDVKSQAGPPGTDIEIKGLFYNVPARRKFLRQPATEGQRVKQWLIHSSIANPAIHYRLYADGKLLLNLPTKGSLLERAKTVFRGSVVCFESEQAQMQIQGLVGHPSLAQADAGSFVILINRRLVSDRMILKAVRDGFLSTLKEREYPIGFIAIEISPDAVDVNVHPQKSEVRFRHGREVFAAVKQAVESGVRNFSQPLASDARRAIAEHSYQPAGIQQVLEQRTAVSSSIVPQFASAPADEEPENLLNSAEREGHSSPEMESHQEFSYSALRYVGQVLECYLICEWQSKLYVVDMHAAHERYNYNLIRSAIGRRAVESQVLLIPQTVELGEAGVQNCVKFSEIFESFGFSVEAFGESTLLVRAVPALLAGSQIQSLIKDVAVVAFDEMAQSKFEEQLDYVAARIACHASVRSGYQISREEVYALFQALDSTEFSSACPHGRPVIVSFQSHEVERWFGRDR